MEETLSPADWGAVPVDGPLKITVRPPSASPADWGAVPVEKMGAAEDFGRSIGAGLVRGGAGIVGLPDALANLINLGDRKITGETPEAQQARLDAKKQKAPIPDFLAGLSTEEILGEIKKRHPGLVHEPQTTPGKYARTASEFATGAVFGPGGPVRNAISYGVLPGLASEGAGQLTEGTAAEPWARAGAALATGGAAAVFNRPGSTGRVIREATDGASGAQVAEAERLFQEAQQAGLPITRAEAVQYVTQGATRLGDVQRVVEGSGAMRGFFAQRPQQVEAAARQGFDTIAPPTAQPSAVGPAVGRAAEDAVNDVRGVINAGTDPYYATASTVRLTPQEMARARALPGFEEARRAVRGDPQLNRYVANLPDDSVGFLNEVKKYLDNASENATSPVTQQGRNMQRSAGYGQDARDARNIGIAASSEYEVALRVQEQARREHLEPLLRGPLGKLADSDRATKTAIDVLFPRNPLPNSAAEIEIAVSALAARHPAAAAQLVRAHAESVFNQATRNLQSGPNQWGGAGFAAALRGNPQQAANLEAAVRALPNGEATWQGFSRMLDFMEAQGTRQHIGSQTAFNQNMQKQLAQGGNVEGAVKVAAGLGVTAPRKIMETVERWRMGNNVNQLADLFTNPEAGRRFAQLARSNSVPQTTALIARLVYIASSGKP